MDTTVRNLDEATYRAIKSRAALSGRTIGDVMNEALRSYLARPDRGQRPGSLAELQPESYPAGSEHLSDEIDSIVYGAQMVDSI